MSIKSMNPYLNFNNGTAEKAIKLYETALGAKAENVMRFGDAPGMTVPDAAKGRILHARLRVGNAVFMLSDVMPDNPVHADGKSNAWVSLDFDDAGDMAKKFDAL